MSARYTQVIRPANGVSTIPIPHTQARIRVTRCKRTCCWTPFGHKVDAVGCTCHRQGVTYE